MTTTTRKRVQRVTLGEIRTKREDRIRQAAARRRRPEITPAQAEYARAVLDPLYGAVIVEDDPLAPDAFFGHIEEDGRLDYDTIATLSTRADADSKRTNRCADCGKWYMSRDQLTKHRAKVHPSLFECGSGDACYLHHYIAAELAVQPNALPVGVHTTAAEAARCREKAAAIVTAPAAARPVAAVRVAPRADNLAPCPRCGRIDWQTANGRQWHLDNYAECADQRKPDRHQYQESAA